MFARFSRLEYFDEAVRDPASQTAVPVDIHQPPAFLHKILQLSAVQLFYDSTGTVQVMETSLLRILYVQSLYIFFISFTLLFISVYNLCSHLLISRIMKD